VPLFLAAQLRLLWRAHISVALGRQKATQSGHSRRLHVQLRSTSRHPVIISPVRVSLATAQLPATDPASRSAAATAAGSRLALEDSVDGIASAMLTLSVQLPLLLNSGAFKRGPRARRRLGSALALAAGSPRSLRLIRDPARPHPIVHFINGLTHRLHSAVFQLTRAPHPLRVLL